MNPDATVRASDGASQAMMAAPSVIAVAVTKFLGLEIDAWLGLVGIGFLLLQAAYLVWRWRRDVKREAARAARPQPSDQDWP